MSFLSPWRLLLLAGPVVLLVAYGCAQRARRRALVRFSSVELLASVAPRRPGWQRHVPATVLLLALVAGVVGFAQPTRAVRTPRERATIILALDVSASMSATDVAPSRLAAAEAQARQFVSALPAGLAIGLISFDRSARALVAPTTDRAAVLRAIETLQIGPGTATGDAIYLSLETIAGVGRTADGKAVPAVIVLMSDGTPTVGRGDQTPTQTVDAATASAKQAGIRIDTIAFGTQAGVVTVQGRTIAVPADPDAMARIAAQSGGVTFAAKSAGQLRSVYDQIGRAVGYDVRRREITAWFTGLALALAMLAAGTALVWTQRLV